MRIGNVNLHEPILADSNGSHLTSDDADEETGIVISASWQDSDSSRVMIPSILP